VRIAWINDAVAAVQQCYHDFYQNGVREPSADLFAQQLYGTWYICPSAREHYTIPPIERCLSLYRALHAKRCSLESGWQVKQISTKGRILAIRDQQERVLMPGEFVWTLNKESTLKPGSTVDVTSMRESSDALPGFWVSHSAGWEQITGLILRIYWNTGFEGALTLIKSFTDMIPAGIEYSFKVPVEPEGFNRADVVLLYISHNDFELLLPTLKQIHTDVVGSLQNETPKLTHQLGTGLSFAIEPREVTESFGTHRCRLIAQAATSSTTHQPISDQELYKRIEHEFLQTGINLEWPHLDKRVTDGYPEL